jgi:hypothetical protein
MKINIQKTISAFVLIWVFIFSSPFLCSAQGLQDAGSKLGEMQNQGVTLSSNLQGTANIIVRTIFYLVGTAFLILVIYGGIVWMKAAGRDTEVARAKKIIATSIIGVVVLLLSYALTNFIMSRLGGS